MPKVGRLTSEYDRNDSSNTNYLFGSGAVTRNAPFGNTETPNLKVKIIGGKNLPVTDTAVFQHPDSYEQALACPAPKDIHQLNSLGPSSWDEQFPKRGRKLFNPHVVIPPITPRDQDISVSSRMTPREGASIEDMDKPRPLSQLDMPVDFTQEKQLKESLCKELEGFKVAKLKDVYLELTGFDRNMSGFVNNEDLAYALLRAQMAITPKSLRYLSVKFASPEKTEKVNYENLLSFIGKLLNTPSGVESPRQESNRPNNVTSSPRKVTLSEDNQTMQDHYFNPITHQDEDYSSGSNKFPFHDRNNAKLLRYIEQQLMESETELDFEKIWVAFMQADRAHRGKLSRHQIKDLTIQCRIPLQDSLVDQIINKCEESYGQYDWQQYLEFIERVKPIHTGLNIPVSKKPTEFARRYPTPSTNWPKEGQNETYRGNDEIREVGLKQGVYTQDANQDEKQSADMELKNTEEAIARSEAVKKKLLEKGSVTSEPWFERFIKLAEEMYSVDSNASGCLSVEEAQWLVQKHNVMQHLHLSDRDIITAITECEKGGKVPIHPLLRLISLKGP